MAVTGEVESRFYEDAERLAAELREVVADQLHDLVIERQNAGSERELIEKVAQVGRVGRAIREALGRQQQALELGLPVSKAVADERENRRLLRAAVMSLGAACGALVATLDFDQRRVELERNGRRDG